MYTLVRAILTGNDGVTLEGLRIGNRWTTSIEALQRWAEQRTAAIVAPASSRSRSDRSDQNERVERQLQRLGM